MPQRLGSTPRINWAHPLAKDLVVCIVPDVGDLLTNAPPVVNDTTNCSIPSTVFGKAVRQSSAVFVNSTGVSYALPASSPLWATCQANGSGLSWAVLGNGVNVPSAGYGGHMISVPNDNNSAGHSFAVHALSFANPSSWVGRAQINTTGQGDISWAGSVNGYFNSTPDPVTLYGGSVLLGDAPGAVAGLVSFYRNGALFDTAALPSYINNVGWNTKQPLTVGAFSSSYASNSQQMPGDYGLVLLFGRVLSAVEHAMLAADPWGLLDQGDEAAPLVVDFGGGGPVVYTMTASGGSFALTGQAAALRAQRRLLAAQGSLALTGQAAALRAQRRVTAAQGSFALTGQAAALRAQRRIVAGQGTFSLSGQAAILSLFRRLTAGAGTLALTGQAAALRAQHQMPAAVGTFALTGQPAALRAQHQLLASQGSFALTGQAAILSLFRRLTSAVGTFSLTGQAAALRAQHRFPADVGLFAFTGQDAAFTANGARSIAAGQGAFALTGQAAALRAQRQLLAAVGSFALTGQVAGLRAQRQLAAGAGLFAETGQAAALRHTARLTAAQGAFTFTGQAALFQSGRLLVASPGSFVLTGQAAALRHTARLVAAQGSFGLTGQAALFQSGRFLFATPGVFVLTGQPVLFVVERAEAGLVYGFCVHVSERSLSLVRLSERTANDVDVTARTCGLAISERLC